MAPAEKCGSTNICMKKTIKIKYAHFAKFLDNDATQ